MIIIYILAVIGGILVVGIIGMGILIACTEKDSNEWTEPVCVLTGEPCKNTDASEGTCEDCQIAKDYFKAQEGERWS